MLLKKIKFKIIMLKNNLKNVWSIYKKRLSLILNIKILNYKYDKILKFF